MKRVSENDLKRLKAADGHMMLAQQLLEGVDLRQYRADEEAMNLIRQARVGVKSATRAIRSASGLRWKR